MIKSFELCKWTNPASATNNNSASSIPHSYLVKCATIANIMLTPARDKGALGSWHLQRRPKPKSSSTVAPTQIRLSSAWNVATATKELSFYIFFHFNDFKNIATNYFVFQKMELNSPSSRMWALLSDSLTMNRKWQRWWSVTPKGRSQKTYCFHIVLSQIIHSGGSQLPCHKGPEAALWRGLHGKEQCHPGSSQH